MLYSFLFCVTLLIWLTYFFCSLCCSLNYWVYIWLCAFIAFKNVYKLVYFIICVKVFCNTSYFCFICRLDLYQSSPSLLSSLHVACLCQLLGDALYTLLVSFWFFCQFFYIFNYYYYYYYPIIVYLRAVSTAQWSTVGELMLWFLTLKNPN